MISCLWRLVSGMAILVALARGQPDVVAAGRQLYNKTCTICHGEDGAEGDRAPALVATRRNSRLSEAAIFAVIKNGIPGSTMPAAGLPDNDIRSIVAFIRNMRSTASDTIVPGDVENGRKVFEGKGGCTHCHMIRGRGGLIGPDLSSIGAELTLARLQESLVAARPIPAGYRPVRVTTLDGKVIEGVAKNEDAFSIQVLDRNDKLQLLNKDELSQLERETTSLMPHNFDKTLTPDEFRDLIAMLSRQARTKARAEGDVGNH